MSIIYRSFKEEDKNKLKEMIFSLYNEDPEGEPINEIKINKTIEALDKHSEKGEIIVFEKDNMIVGYSILIFFWSNEYGGNILSVDELYVKADYRNQGLATNFLRNITEKYTDKAVACMLEVTPSNERAYEYYYSLGFNENSNTHMILKL